MLKQTRCMYSRALHCTAAHSESDEEWRVEYFIVADLLFPVIKRSPHSMDSVCNSFNRQRVIRNGGAEKYENGGNQRSKAAPQIRRVLSRPKNDRFWRVFYPIPPIFFAFSPFPRTYKTNFAKKSGLACIFWPRWRLKVFASTQGGLPPPTQLTNTNIKIMKIRVS